MEASKNQWKETLARLLRRPVQNELRGLLRNGVSAVRPDGGNYTNCCGLDVPSFFGGEGRLFVPLLGKGPYPMSRLLSAERRSLPIAFCEDSFLRAATVFWDKSAPPLARQSVSLTCDASGLYFDATRQSDIERLISEREATDAEVERAKSLIGRIVESRVSKYNNQPLAVPELPGSKSRDKVLVIDQDYGDASILLGQATDGTFRDMVQAALDENPGCDVLVKTHPDSLVAGGRRGNLSTVPDGDRLHKITFPANPYSILETVSKVYVATSTFGFEALMAGKPVSVFGMPWYAGWGVTDDRQTNARRRKKRTLAELFYDFYVIYTRYADPQTRRPCGIDRAIDILVQERKELWAKA